MTVDVIMYMPSEEMDKTIRAKRNSSSGQLSARATAVRDGTQLVPSATAPPARVRVAYTCTMQSV